jgi:putative ABC transport system permease protein
LAVVAGVVAASLGALAGNDAALVAAATLGAGALLAGPLWLIVRGLGRLGRRMPLAGAAGALGWALRGCGRPGGEAVLTGLGLALVASGVTAVLCLRASLLAEVRPETGGPGTFLIDIQPDQVGPLTELAAAAGATAAARPIVPARLVSARRQGQDSEEATFFRRREQRLSWREAAEDGDRTEAGRWIQAPGEASVERRWADRLGVGIGDRLDFLVAGATRSVTVVGLRSVRWTSFRPNFFVYCHPADLADGDATWILALPPMPAAAQDRLLDALRAEAPNALPIDVADGVRTALELTDALAAALAWVAAAAVGAALAVVAGLALAGAPRRRDEAATARALGAPPGLVPAAHRWEAALLGAAGGTLGAVTGIATAALVVAQAEWTLAMPVGVLLVVPAAAVAAALAVWVVRLR